ncbi:MAG TPA: 2,3-bisphosphoglycerate-independent phosphoglycerate mutase [Sedimentisphaerales bacterium]|nr:2,3-bisphosphoglycerate-independent phosphoglycerate mutase [Sedimentisphaerales bacterium]HRS11078.1 2,3-bisphosphoglycerate-independent phosphoglycerate mutase [Sedimentisphaerales bacterium]HRV47714.1 2,3-bisphosphoglycerate-independent phosphoglycerate mutase [Sedimentisphaerales bacterium]
MAKEKATIAKRPCVLIIRDGWGYNPDASEDNYNAIKQAHTPTDDMLMAEYPHCLIHTYGEYVGLPDGTMGNSEVGHQNIGAGRIVPQESVRLTHAIRDGSFFRNEQFFRLVQFIKEHQGKMHLMGLCSDIGVHSLLGHLYGLLELAKRNGLTEVFIHAFTDGRDSPPDSGLGYIRDIEAKAAEIGVGRIATVMGRFYAMDRDSRWDRVQKAYECLRVGKGLKATSAPEAIQSSYNRDVTDEFIEPTCIVTRDNTPLATIDDGDGVVFFNFRGDRPRELTRAFVDPDFKEFVRPTMPDVYFVCMTEYDASIPAPVAFPKLPKMKNILAAYWSELGLKQFRCAETEKYAHVTFFFNDYTEKPFKGEDRQIVPSPKVRTYDLKPEMSAREVARVVLERLDSDKYDVMVINFANPDMVGHTGDLAAAIQAAETVDECVGKILDKVKSMGGAAIVTADHGNFEKMIDGSPDSPHTAHTVGDVPLIVFDDEYKGRRLRDGGTLADIGPTMLEIMGLPQPAEMTGRSLLQGV